MKLPFIQLELEVSKLYRVQFLPSDIEGVNSHYEFVRAFVYACGWTPEEYIETLNTKSYLN